MQGLVRRPHYRLVRRLYHRHETLAPLLLFFGGVTWDALTLQRIGALLDNVILGGYLLLLGGAIALTLLDRHGRPLPPSLRALSTWSVGAIQFLTGGLFSAYVIYYTRSASLTTASLFLLVLVGLLLANEWIWSRHQGGHLLIGLYFLAVFCYLTFLLPVVLGTMSFWVFLTSGILNIGVTTGLLLVLRRQGVFVRLRSFLGALCVIALLFGGLTTFYVQHWIPPVPLALEHIGVYHDADRAGDAFVKNVPPGPGFGRGTAMTPSTTPPQTRCTASRPSTPRLPSRRTSPIAGSATCPRATPGWIPTALRIRW
ncbi:hypothetical protein [Salinibacter ruber]|uniref:Uncharacterized protein n=1 Tax=Salinibacter ruber TaxID=146919 RepID=A0A9X2R6Z9_9BACT|nr:hypothetical protein [Salinibacter ruber]MCS3864168.1 hypothetical protein [Salinibacter ruber]MCS4150947.1 hypothetical protein [Salinibacter ruber]MCS4177740.1 hypothetical protein [Salinibacter ruber]